MGWCPPSRHVGDGGHVAGLQSVLLHACSGQFGVPRRDVLDDKRAPGVKPILSKHLLQNRLVELSPQIPMLPLLLIPKVPT